MGKIKHYHNYVIIKMSFFIINALILFSFPFKIHVASELSEFKSYVGRSF